MVANPDCNMPPDGAPGRRSRRVSRRTKACKRCRDQKIRCDGSNPCDQCSKRRFACDFDSPSQKIIVTRRYINELHEELANYRSKSHQPSSLEMNAEHSANPPEESQSVRPTPEAQSAHSRYEPLPTNPPGSQDTTKANAPLINPLAFHITDWVPGPREIPFFLGTSSSWAFGRRVLGMIHETLTGSPLVQDPNKLLFDEHVYDLKWDGNKANCSQDMFDVSSLPPPNFALHLIGSVKFHLGELFYFLEDANFMNKFDAFQQDPKGFARSSPLWFCHYLLILAFGKSFAVQSAKSKTPSGGDHFIQAMQCMPDFTFFQGDPIEKIQVLCCAALYLQCVDCRSPAYRMIGVALRSVTENGMYTGMRGLCLDEDYIQRSRLIWWTVYVLERRMSSLLGVPMGISEDGIAEESMSASLPSLSRYFPKSDALHMQVTLCQILAKIDMTVYGTDGKVDRRYINATQAVLRDIANVTEQLNTSFNLYDNESGFTGSISRISAHLHLLEHQCIILTTRPLLYIFLQSKLGLSDAALMDWLQSATVKSLLQMCIESAQQSLRILSKLLEQGLLEIFLPFDKEAVFTSAIPLLMASAIDQSLLPDHTPWLDRVFAILEEMDARGNLAASLIRSELKQIHDELGQIFPNGSTSLAPSRHVSTMAESEEISHLVPAIDMAGYSHSLELPFAQSFGQNYELTSDHLLDLANSLDNNMLGWPLCWTDYSLNHDL